VIFASQLVLSLTKYLRVGKIICDVLMQTYKFSAKGKTVNFVVVADCWYEFTHF